VATERAAAPPPGAAGQAGAAPPRASRPGAPTVTVVIPTRDRHERLRAIVRRLLDQTRAIDELIVVDQSATDAGHRSLAELVAAVPLDRRPVFDHVWDRRIDGAAAARNAGLDRARGDIVVCVDDDMVPERDTLERLVAHLEHAPPVAAVTPVITNYAPPSRLQQAWDRAFRRGPFADDRQPVYWHWARPRRDPLVPVRMLGAGMLAIRRTALGDLRFDGRYRGASLGEDIDLSWALAARGGQLAIATDARVVHARGARPAQRYEAALLASWGFVVAKHQPRTLATRLARGWFVTGVVLAAALASCRGRSLAPLRSAASGVSALRHDFRGVAFLAPRAQSMR
jgi:GT2 family glycosyltransferase